MSIIEMTGSPCHDRLVRLVTERGYMNIEELAQLLDALTQIVCRGIRKLSEQGLTTRHHEGTGCVSSVMSTAFEQRRLPLIAEKRVITETATDYLPERYAVLITIGTTVRAVTRVLLNRHDLRIVTNSPRIAQILYKNQDIEMTVPGGILCAHDGGIIGPGTTDSIKGFHVDCLITNVSAIGHDSTPLESGANEALVVRTVIKRARDTLLVVDRTRLTASAAASVGNARGVRAFFTDAPPPNSFCQLLSEENVELVVAEREVS